MAVNVKEIKTIFQVCSTISRPLVNAALNGFNGTLMAYGQTGSGKPALTYNPRGGTQVY